MERRILMKLLTYILLIFTLPVFGQYTDTIYINPTGTGDTLTSWNLIVIADNTAYLQKRGTDMRGGIEVDSKTNVLFGAYGIGSIDSTIVYQNSASDGYFDFIDSETGNFHLQNGSIAIDQGTDPTSISGKGIMMNGKLLISNGKLLISNGKILK